MDKRGLSPDEKPNPVAEFGPMRFIVSRLVFLSISNKLY